MEPEALGEFASLLRVVLDEHLPEINRKLAARYGTRPIHTRINVAGIAHLTGIDRGRLTAWLAGRRLCSRTDLAELGRKLGFTQPELDNLEAARRSVESSRSGNLQTVQSFDPRERPDDLPLTDDADTPVPYDFRNDQLYMIGEWSPARRLHRTQVRTQFVPMHERPPQAWVDESLWKTTVASRKNDTGDLAYITAFKIDHQESDETQFCHVTYAESRYAEVRALEQLRIDQPALLQRADNALRANARHYLANALPSSLAVNVVVVGA